MHTSIQSGHCSALMRAGLNIECILDGKPALGRGELCPGNDNTFVVLQNILDEVLAVFPSKYIHMGGDECGTGTWEKCEVAKVDPKLSLGVQANLWGERMKSFPQVLYMTYPRACALAEVAWSPDGPRDYAGFFKRVQTQFKRLDAAGINYRQPTATDQPE